MDEIVLRDQPTDDKCKNCSLIYITNGIIYNGVRHVLVDNTIGEIGCLNCSLKTQCTRTGGIYMDICSRTFNTSKCHFEIK